MSVTIPTIILTVGGTVLTFTGTEVISAKITEEVNPLSIELPYNVLEFKIHNTDTTFSMFSGSVYSQLSERLPVMVYENVNGVSEFMGKFYLDTWKNTSEYEFEFRAIDVIGTMAATDYDGGFWATATTLETVLNQVLLPKNILYTIDETIKSVEIQGWIPPGDYRKALQQICFAAGAVASCARSDRLVISPIELPYQLYDGKIHNSEKLKSQPIELLKLVTSIELVSHSYTQGTELQTIFDKYLEAGSHKIVFNQPYYNIIVDGPGFVPSVLILENGDYFAFEDGDHLEVSGEYIFDSPNSLRLEMQEAGQVTITGYPWVDSKRSYLFFESGLTEYSNKNALIISEATMVNENNAQTVLNRLRDYYRQRYKQTITLLPSSYQTKDIIASSTLFEKTILGFVQKMDMNLVGGFLQVTDIRGIEPVYVAPTEHPLRRVTTGVGICGADLTYNNRWRNYHAV
jgi:hypothetical protein